jgi:N-acetylglucosamine kinase-like BadF-type ATPase
MNYLIGIDGGGTKTTCVITDKEGKLLHECSGGPSNILVFGTETVSENILQLIKECTDKFNLSFNDIAAVVVGTAGAGRKSDAEKLENDFRRYAAFQAAEFKTFHVESDARIALEGAFSGKPGSILISGTGSIMFGKDKKDNLIRVGGFGRIIGDEGSGYALGRKALTAASKEYDGRGEKTMITQLLNEKHDILSSDTLITEVYRNNFDVALAATIVTEAASKGDKAALQIIDEETGELLQMIHVMYKRIKENKMNISLIGSLITGDNLFAETFREKLSELKNVNIMEPEHSPAMGAVLLAKRLI